MIWKQLRCTMGFHYPVKTHEMPSTVTVTTKVGEEIISSITHEVRVPLFRCTECKQTRIANGVWEDIKWPASKPESKETCMGGGVGGGIG